MDTSFAAGQVWRYAARSDEPDSLVTICKVEPFGEDSVIHIRVSGLKLKNPRTPQGFQDVLPHLPISEAALRSSVTELLKEDAPLPDYQDGYRNWQEAKGGIWTQPVAEIITMIEGTVESAVQPKKRWWQRA